MRSRGRVDYIMEVLVSEVDFFLGFVVCLNFDNFCNNKDK